MAKLAFKKGFPPIGRYYKSGTFAIMDNKDTAPAKIGESVKISTDAIAICKKVKYLTGVPMGRFIVEAVYEKAKRLPKKVREQIFKD